MIFWSHQYPDGSKLFVHVANDGELCIEMVHPTKGTELITFLPRGAVEELKNFLSMKGF